jgi:hypothetical protein
MTIRSNAPGVQHLYYAEIAHSGAPSEHPENPSRREWEGPVDNQVVEFKILLDAGSGTWSFFVGGNPIPEDKIPVQQTAFWQTHLGNLVKWSGETWNHCDHLSGTSDNPCVFSNCKYLEGALWLSPYFYDVPAENQNPEHFVIEVTGDHQFQMHDNRD